MKIDSLKEMKKQFSTVSMIFEPTIFFWNNSIFFKKVTPNIIQFYKLSQNNTHVVMALLKM